MVRIPATKATVEVPEAELLDVGIRVFDPNIPESTEEQEKKRVFPDVRKAESRYMPVVLRDTLEGTGQWGQVRVLPANGTGMDLFVDGKILESTGRELKLAITATDATGRVWLAEGIRGRGGHARVQGRRRKAPRPVREPLQHPRQRPARGARRAHERAARADPRGLGPAFRRGPRAVRVQGLPRARIARASTRSSGCRPTAIRCSRAWSTSASAITRSSTH